MTDIANCPFCGQAPEIMSYGDSELFTGEVWFLLCVDCGYQSGEKPSEQEAVMAHNRVASSRGDLDLHNEIMNISHKMNSNQIHDGTYRIAYMDGHRDARLAAADLVLGHAKLIY